MKYLIPLLTFVLLFSCKSDDDTNEPVSCTEEFVYGLNVQVRDAATNGIILNNIEVTATDGNYSEDLVFMFDTFVGAGEREGSYVLTVIAQGYDNLTSNVIIVEKTEDDCHVITENVDLRLNPN